MTLKCPKCNRQFKTKAALLQHERDSHREQPSAPKKTSKKRGLALPTVTSPARATVVVSQEEYLGEVAVPAGRSSNLKAYKIIPGGSGLARLDQFGSLFEQWRMERWVVKARPKVGTTISGSYILGVFYESMLTPTTKAEVGALSPKVMGPIWQGATLSVPPNLAQKQRWLYTHGSGVDEADAVAGQIVVAVDGEAEKCRIDLWVSYTITFMGPTAHKRIGDQYYHLDGSNWKDQTGKPVTQIPQSDGPYTADFEVGNASYVDRIVSGFTSAFRQWQELHRTVSNGVTYIHGILNGIDAAGLVNVGAQVGAVVALQRRPFRPALPPAESIPGSSGQLSYGVGGGEEGDTGFEFLAPQC